MVWTTQVEAEVRQHVEVIWCHLGKGRPMAERPEEFQTNGHDMSVEMEVKSVLADALAQLTQLWHTFGLSDEEQVQQKRLLVVEVRKSCSNRVANWRREVDKASARVEELEKEVQQLKAQFHGNESAKWCFQSLEQLCSGALRDRLAALDMEFKFLDSVRVNREAEVNKLREQLSQMDRKLGTTSVLPSDMSDLSEEYKTQLHNMVNAKSREVHTRRAALLEAVSECVQLARDLQIEAEFTFAEDVNARLKKRDLSADMLQKIAQRAVELRELKLKREARLGEMLGQIHELWGELQIPEIERERFRNTVYGVGKSALASCKAELTRLHRHHKRFSATVEQVANLRKTIVEHWDRIGHSLDQRKYFEAMMTAHNSELTFRIFRAHEKEVDKLKRQLFGMRFLTNYVVKREEILKARDEHGVPDEATRMQIERDLPKYTEMLLDRIAKWEKETGVVFRWNGQSYLKQMRSDDNKQRQKTKQTQHRKTSQVRDPTGAPGSRRRVQQTNRHSIEERAPPRLEGVETEFRRRRSDPQAPERPRWRNFIRSTLWGRDS